MDNERWWELKDRMNEKFKDVKEAHEEEVSEDDVGHKIVSKIETLEFTSPLGKIKIVRTTRPKIIDKKAHYHKGSGGAKVEYVLSTDEMTHKMDIYKKDDVTGEWRILDIPSDNLRF